MGSENTMNGIKLEGKIKELAEQLTKSKSDGRLTVDDLGNILTSFKEDEKYSAIKKDTLIHLKELFKWTRAAEEWISDEIRNSNRSI